MRTPSHSPSPKTRKHNEACRRYRNTFYEAHGYLFCEFCQRSNAFRYEAHHIIYASKAPGHPLLHDDRNLILLCDTCHANWHGAKMQEAAKRIIAERGLKALLC